MQIRDKFIIKLLKRVDFKNKKILEIGCGNGLRTQQFSKVKGIKITAIDPNIKDISFAKRNYNKNNITYLIARAEKLPFKAKQFDLVVFTFSLHHIKIPKRALSEARRVLKEKGFLVIIEPGLKGTIFQTEIIFGTFDGDEQEKKGKIYKIIMQYLKMKHEGEFWSKSEYKFDSLSDFKKNMFPKKNIPKLKEFLIKNNYRLWGERRINILSKV